MYRYETHLHTIEGSACGFTHGVDYPAIYKERGYDGIFITDHFFHGNTRPSRELPWPEYVDAYMKGYEEAKRSGCRSVVAGVPFIGVVVLGAVMLLKKKEDENK